MAKRPAVIDGSARRIPEPKKPSAVRYVELPDEQPEELFEFQDEPGGPKYLDAALQGVMAELGERDTDSKVTVKRRSVLNGVPREDWLFECHPAAFSIPDLQAHYGAGEYRITVYGKQDGSNYKVIHADKKLHIGEAPGGAKPTAPAVAPAPAVDVRREVSDALAAPLTALANVIAQAMPKASSRADTFAEMKQMAELFAMMRGNAPAAPDPMAMLTQAVTLMQKAAPAPVQPLTEDGDLSPNFVLGKAIELVQSLMSAHQEQRANTAALPAPAKPAAPAAGEIAAAPQGAANEGADAVKLALRLQLGFLLNAASMDSPPETYAALIYEQAPDEIIEALRGEKWRDALLALEPKFGAFMPWAEKVRAEVLSMIAEDSPPEGEAATLTTAPDAGKNAADAPAPVPPVKAA